MDAREYFLAAWPAHSYKADDFSSYVIDNESILTYFPFVIEHFFWLDNLKCNG